MKFQKVIALLLTAALACSLASCGNSNTPSAGSSAAPPQSAAGTSSGGGGDDLAAALADMKPVKMNLACSLGASHRAVEVIQKFCDEVSEKTEGKVTITIYAGETLVKNTDIFESVVNGVVDMGESDPSYSFSYFPLTSAYFLSGVNFANSKAATYAANDWFQSDFAELGKAKFLWAYGMSPSNLLTNKKVEKLEDFKGVQIRATGYAIDAVQTLGASAVGITPAETYEALLKGTADAALMPAEALINWNFGEVVKYVERISGISTVTHYVAINWDKWNALPAPVQQVIEECSVHAVENIAPLWDEMDQLGIDFAVEKGAEVIEVPNDVMQTWWDTLAPIQQKWVDERTKQGLDAQGALDRLKELANKYNTEYGS